MPALDDKNDVRNIVPRWRRFHDENSRVEAHPLSQGENLSSQPVGSLDHLIADWKKHGTFSYAADLLSCAVAIQSGEKAKDAARLICDDPRRGFKTLRAMARKVLGIAPAEQPAPEINDSEDLHHFEGNVIRELRVNAKLYPRNPFLWMDIAFTYEILGIPEKAEKAIRIALALAPENRTVLRSACRFLIHEGRPREAYELLLHSDPLTSDPWLMAAFLATSQVAKKPPRFVKVARRMLDASRFGAFHVSELASAIGVLELKAGKSRIARNMFDVSLIQPTENSLAQAFWMVKDQKHISCVREEVTPLNSNEAIAWEAMSVSRWQDSLSATWKWLKDQPFSARPAVHGSYIASLTLNKFEDSARIAKIGLLANPHDTTLMNNYAFAAAQAGDIASAQEAFDKIKFVGAPESDRTCFTATQGLLHFRAGNLTQGRICYQEAIRLAVKTNDRERQMVAMAYLALEELRAKTPESERFRREALELSTKVSKPELQALIKQLDA